MDIKESLERVQFFQSLINWTLRIMTFYSFIFICRKDRAATVNLWSKLLKDTKYKAKTSASLGDILSKNIATRFGDLSEDINRISKNVSTSLFISVDEIINCEDAIYNFMFIQTGLGHNGSENTTSSCLGVHLQKISSGFYCKFINSCIKSIFNSTSP